MVALPCPRPLAKQLLPRSTRLFTRPATTASLLRVNCRCRVNNDGPNAGRGFGGLGSVSKQARSYATDAAKPASRPKAHTGRASASRTKKPQATAKTKKKPAKKPKKKAVKKTKRKVRKAPSKTALRLKERKQQADIKAAALLSEPKQLPQTAFSIVFTEEAKKGGDVKSRATEASQRYKNLSAEERESYNHQANLNKEKNVAAYKRWVQSHTPLEIKQANSARRALARKAKAAGKKTTYPSIKDDRTVKQARNAYSYFFADRHASGDLKGLSIGEAGKLLGREWKELSSSEVQIYTNKAEADKTRYVEEYKTVYGIDSPSSLKKTSS